MKRDTHDDRRTRVVDLESDRSEMLLAGDPDPGPVILCPTCKGALFAADDECLAGAVARIAKLESVIASVTRHVEAAEESGRASAAEGLPVDPVIRAASIRAALAKGDW